MKNKKSNVTTWSKIKDRQFGKIGTPRRDELERDFESFRIGILLRQARESKLMTQEQLAQRVSKKRSYISRIENDVSNITIKTLYEIVEIGLGGKVRIEIDWNEIDRFKLQTANSE
ncbi:MAG TPA: helix-turn-helix transcriptional regulator [Bacteroidales bacterium]|nr:helix-turn-helix transcriptional regulator [Bacteroidales bacterium]